jgi:antitoxin component YwqK of YwqJK toxin-antitoxin module
MKKKILVSTLLLILGFILYQLYIFFLAPSNNLKGIYLVPKDAVMVIETQKPIDNWQEVSSSDIWKHLQKNNYFKELTKSLNSVDNVFNEQKKLIDLIGNRALIISIHVTQKKKYDLLYIADLQKIAKLNLLKTHLSSFVNDSYKLSKRKFHNHEILEFYNVKSRETLYISFIENQLIASFTHSLVEHAIDQYSEPVIGRDLAFIDISKKVGYDKMFRLYVQYKYMNSYLNCFFDQTDNLVKNMNKTFNYSGFNFDLKSNNIILADGFTNTNENASLYLKALQKSGKGKHTIAKIAPKRTALYISFAFNSFDEFYKNFEQVQKENPKQFKAYQDNLDKVENYLDINIKKHFISWIDDEIALLQMQSANKSINNELALVFKVKDKKEANKNLKFILEKIRKKTPVKFKEITYKNHKINYMSIKGFFKILLGDMFNSFDRPYFTLIDDYIVFTNHPNTLKNIIDDYLGKETLDRSEDYQDFNNYFEKKSSAFTYINTPILYKNIYALADKTTKKQLAKNKDFIICFPQIGFQLTPYINMFESKFVVSYQDPNIVKSKEQFKEKLIGPRQNEDINTSTTTNHKNILEIEKNNLFKVATINPSDLDSDQYVVKYKNGKTKIKVDIEDGVPNGRYKEYYANGELKLKGRFKKGKQVKTWKAYDSNGNFLKKKSF